jgi:DNA-binding LytR/AlgR family response regulator
VYAEDKYTLARVVGEPNPFFLQCNPSLISIEGDLLAAGFVRVSRSHLVNKALILRVYRSEALKYHVDLVDDVSVDVSRSYASAVKAAVMEGV